jgi:hypothetical protein
MLYKNDGQAPIYGGCIKEHYYSKEKYEKRRTSLLKILATLAAVLVSATSVSDR